MRHYQIDRTTGCLVSAFIMLIVFSFMTAIGRLLFTTPIGWSILAFIVIRHIWTSVARNRQQTVYREQVFEKQQKQQEESIKKQDSMINTDNIVDVDYVEVVDLDKSRD